MSAALAQAALRLVGVPFRLHGRNPATGLDCVGLVGVALEQCGHRPELPRGYTLRALDSTPFLHLAARCGLREVSGSPVQDGDVLLVAVHALQPHLLISVPGGFVHAHAGLGRVTMLPAPLGWPVLRHWRLSDGKD